MADMQISMKLSLSDAASGPITAFMEKVKALESAISAINRRFSTFTAGMDKIGASAGGAVAGTERLEGSLAKLGTSLEVAAQRMLSATGEMMTLGKTAMGTGQAIDSAAGKMASAGGTVDVLRGKVSELNTTLRGMAELWGALKIEQGLKGSVQAASSYQVTLTRMQNMQLGAGNNQALVAAANQASKDVPQVDRNKALELGIDLVNATGSVQEATRHLTEFAKAEYVMKMATPEGKNFNTGDMLMIAKALEQRGATMDPARLSAELDMFTKIYGATQGRVGAKELLGNIQYAKGGLGNTMDIGFLPVFASMIEQIRSMGGNGGQIGTALTSLQQAVVGGVIKQSALPEWHKMGLLDPSKEVWNKVGSLKGVQAGGIAGSSEFQRNPYMWVQQYLVPALKKSGIDINDNSAVNTALAHMFGNRNAANIASMMVTRAPQLEKDAHLIRQEGGINEQYGRDIETAKAKVDAFTTSVHNLAIAFGGPLLGAFSSVVSALTTFINLLTKTFQEHETVAKILAVVAAIIGMRLAIAGIKNVFGVFGTLTQLLVGTATTATETGAAVSLMRMPIGFAGAAIMRSFSDMLASATTTGAKMVAVAGWIGKGMLKLIPIIGWIATAYSLADVLAHLKVGGVEIINWVIGWGDTFVTSFANLWEKVKGYAKAGWEYVSSMGRSTGQAAIAQANAAIAANNAALDRRLNASGMRRTSGFWGIGALPSTPSSHAAPKESHPEMPSYPAGKLFPSGGYSVGGGAGTHASRYNAEADAAKQAYRLEEDALKRHLAAIQDAFRKHKISIDAYYADRLATETKAITAEIAQLQREKAAYEKAGDKHGVASTQTEITLKQRDLAAKQADIEAQKQDDLNKLKEDGLRVEKELAKLQGHDGMADRLHVLDEEIAKRKEIFTLNGDDTHAKQLDQIKELTEANMRFAAAMDKVRELQEEERLAEERLTNAVQAGILTRYQAQQQMIELRYQLGMQKSDVLSGAAGYATDPQHQLELQRAQQEASQALHQFNQDALNVRNSAQDAFAGFFKDTLTNANTWSARFHKLLYGIVDTINSIISKRLGDALVNSLFGSADASGNGSGMLGQFIGWLFGGSSSSTSSGASSGNIFSSVASGIGNWVSGLLSFDTGTDFVPRDMIAQIHKGEMIIPANSRNNAIAMMTRNNAMNVVNNFAFNGPVDTRTMSQMAAANAQALQKAAKRNL